MRYDLRSDRIAIANRLYRERQKARNKAIVELKDKADRLGFTITRKCHHCGQPIEEPGS